MDKKWNLSNLPPKNNKDVAEFANNLFDIANQEKIRLGKNEDFLSYHSLYMGKTGGPENVQPGLIPVNLYMANVERTVAVITARKPVGVVEDLDGTKDDGCEDILSAKLQKWWINTGQQEKLRATAQAMEIYGFVSEKPAWDKNLSQPTIALNDPFAFFPAPGLYEDLDTDMPFMCYVYLRYVSEVEKEFGVKDIVPDEAYDLLGTVREEFKGSGYGPIDQSLTGTYDDPYTKKSGTESGSVDKKLERCLVKEIWVRDRSTKKVSEEHPVINPETGMPEMDENGQMIIQKITKTVAVYPDGIRKITIAETDNKGKNKSGYVVLDDSANPNINPALPVEVASTTHPWGRFPCYYTNSYRDQVSMWGFPAAVQTGDLIVKINQIISKLVNYVVGVMSPPLIVQRNCGITQEEIATQLEKTGRLLLMPTTPNARIEFMQIPNLPSTFFDVLNTLVGFFDRVYAIEDADRGQAPSGVIAASAIAALQERNQVLIQAKTTSVERLAEHRSRWCLGLYTNFGTSAETVDVAGEPQEFIGTRFAGRKFGYVVESGSIVHKTDLTIQEQSMELYQMGVIDRQALLETLNYPGWKEIVERSGEGQLDQALQILIAAGMPEEGAMQLKQYLMQPGQGPGGSKTEPTKTTASKTAKAGVPKAKQQ